MNELCRPHFEPLRGGPPKKPFRTRHAAEAAISAIKRGTSKADHRPQRAFLCDGCGKWFLTSEPG